jgi:hypothetical protein
MGTASQGNDMTEREAFTARVLSALVTELADAKENLQRIEASIVALATEHGVKMPEQPTL